VSCASFRDRGTGCLPDVCDELTSDVKEIGHLSCFSINSAMEQNAANLRHRCVIGSHKLEVNQCFFY